MYYYNYKFDENLNYWIKQSNYLKISIPVDFMKKFKKINWNTLYIGICSEYFSIENVRKFLQINAITSDNLIELIILDDDYDFFELIERNCENNYIDKFYDSRKQLEFIIINYLNETEKNFDNLFNKICEIVESFETKELSKFSITFDFTEVVEPKKILNLDLEEYLNKYSNLYLEN